MVSTVECHDSPTHAAFVQAQRRDPRKFAVDRVGGSIVRVGMVRFEYLELFTVHRCTLYVAEIAMDAVKSLCLSRSPQQSFNSRTVSHFIDVLYDDAHV